MESEPASSHTSGGLIEFAFHAIQRGQISPALLPGDDLHGLPLARFTRTS